MAPEHSFRGLYPFPAAHCYDRHSMVDLDAPDADAWPLFERARARPARARAHPSTAPIGAPLASSFNAS